MFSFSIIVVSLNTKKDLLKTINSINTQTFKNYELIVIDGNSKDGTINEIKKIKKKNFRYVIEKDKGIYDAMNKGIRKSKAKWIIFLNSGDIFYSKKTLSKIFEISSVNKDIIYGNTIIKNNKLKYLSNAQNFSTNQIIMPFCHQSSIVKKKIISKFKFDLNYKLSSDFNFFYKCFIAGKSFFKIEEILSVIKAGGLSDMNRQGVYNENIKILLKYNKPNLLIKIYYLKIKQYIIDFIKYIIPNNLIFFFLKIKYKNKRIK